MKCEIISVRLNLLTATSESSPFYGKVNLKVLIGKCFYEHEFLLADIKDDGILGMDFLTKHKCDVLLSREYFLLNREKIPCFYKKGDNQVSCCRIVVSEKVIIPPESETIVPGKVIDGIDRYSVGILEPYEHFEVIKGILVARTAVDLNKNVVPIRMANLGKEPCEVYENTVAAVFETVEIHETYAEKVRTSKVEVSTESQTEIPDHLKDLYDKSRVHLSLEQTDKLAEVLIKHQSVFSKSPHDLGCIDLVEHAIVTGNAKPIKLRPYRIPLSKKVEAEKEIKSMAERGIIEPSCNPWCSPIVMVFVVISDA